MQPEPVIQPMPEEEPIIEEPVPPAPEEMREPDTVSFPAESTETSEPTDEQMPSSFPENDREPPMYPATGEETPSPEQGPAPDEQEKPVEKISDIEEKPGENITFL